MDWARLGVVLMCGGLMVSCRGSGSSSTPTAPTPTPAPASGTTSISIPMGATSLTTTAYVPNPVTVSVGTTVTWVNDDTVSHTSTSNARVWDSGDMPPGSRFSFRFQSTGSFPYVCLVHPNMVGTINVQ